MSRAHDTAQSAVMQGMAGRCNADNTTWSH